MKTTNQEIFRQREKLEQLRLKKKYEELGYKVSVPRPSIRKDRIYTPDLRAINENTGDEIIFEIKFRSGLKKIKKGDILQMRNRCLKSYPKARFILVLPNEVEEKTHVESILNDLLLSYLENKYSKYFKNNIEGFSELTSIEEITMNYVNFNDFQNISIRGEANLKFYIFREDKDFFSLNISDGIPFQFNLRLIHNQIEKENQTIYRISEESKIIFDLSEFN